MHISSRLQAIRINRNGLRARRACRVLAAAANGPEIAVVGGGVGGLVAAARLARQGFRVQVFEQGDRVGGRLQSVSRSGYRFDTGPSLLLFPDTYRQTFRDLGADIDQRLQLVKIEPAGYRQVERPLPATPEPRRNVVPPQGFLWRWYAPGHVRRRREDGSPARGGGARGRGCLPQVVPGGLCHPGRR